MTTVPTEGPDSYGQVHPIETPTLVEAKLKDFDEQLQKATSTPNEANAEVLLATQECPNLLTRDFRLSFLRCEVFDTELAVARYLRYWKKRVEVFGKDKAFLPLTLDKALAGNSTALEIGFFNYLAGHADHKGRGILVAMPRNQDSSKYTRIQICQAAWYFIHAALEVETCQKHGLIFLADPSGAKFSQFDRKMQQLVLSSLQSAVPVRISAFHICRPPAFASIILPIMKMFLNARLRKRIQLHPGTPEQVAQRLGEYGLDKANVPISLGGQVTVDTAGWLAKRKAAGL